MDETKLWEAAQIEIGLHLTELPFKTWFAPTKARLKPDDTLEIICINNYNRQQIKKMYDSLIQTSVEKVGKKKYKISYAVETPAPDNSKVAETPLFKEATNPTTAAERAGLNPKYTFENYIMGGANQLAYAIATSIADKPGRDYNPFFIYSGVGLGKTHLIQAIGNRILNHYPNLTVIYCTSEDFTNDVVESIRKGKDASGQNMETFRKKYRKADVLLIDDIQFIAGKEKTQEELFHTFNALYQKQKQIVLTSDRPPEAFKNIEERITSRFKSGIMADMQKPDFELRAAILRAKRDRNHDEMPNEVIDYIAEIIQTNTRELEGAYLQVLTNARANGDTLDVQSAQRALTGITGQKVRGTVNLNHILQTICNYYSIKQSDIKGKRRNKEFVLPRQVAMYLMHDLTQTPYMSIGDYLGGRDHTTVMHGVRKMEGELKTASQTKQDITNIKNFIYQK